MSIHSRQNLTYSSLITADKTLRIQVYLQQTKTYVFKSIYSRQNLTYSSLSQETKPLQQTRTKPYVSKSIHRRQNLTYFKSIHRRQGQNLPYRSLFTGDEDKTLRIQVYSQDRKPYVFKSIQRKHGRNDTYRIPVREKNEKGGNPAHNFIIKKINESKVNVPC